MSSANYAYQQNYPPQSSPNSYRSTNSTQISSNQHYSSSFVQPHSQSNKVSTTSKSPSTSVQFSQQSPTLVNKNSHTSGQRITNVVPHTSPGSASLGRLSSTASSGSGSSNPRLSSDASLQMSSHNISSATPPSPFSPNTGRSPEAQISPTHYMSASPSRSTKHPFSIATLATSSIRTTSSNTRSEPIAMISSLHGNLAGKESHSPGQANIKTHSNNKQAAHNSNLSNIPHQSRSQSSHQSKNVRHDIYGQSNNSSSKTYDGISTSSRDDRSAHHKQHSNASAE